MSQTNSYGDPTKRADARSNAAHNDIESTSSGKSSIPLSKSASLKTFSDKTGKLNYTTKRFDDDGLFRSADKASTKTISNAGANANAGSMQMHSMAPAKSSIASRSFVGRNRANKNDSESSSGSDLIDLTSKNAVPITDMYNDDIYYMNNYLKSLPDYNELNRKISNEQQKCEDIYDRLLCINSSLKSNLLAKSNSYHSICTASTKPYQSISARNDNTAKNKITRSSSSSIVNQNLINNNNPDKVGATSIKLTNSMNSQLKTSQMNAKPTKPSAINDMYQTNALPKSASSTTLHRNNSKKGFNDFWCENLAKSNQQKLGWNYNKIIATRPDANCTDQNIPPAQAPCSGYKLQKNMSLSQLDQKIRQNVSREELYNMMCNNEPANVDPYKRPDQMAVKPKPSVQFKPQPTNIPATNPLSKSFSQNSMPSILQQFTKKRSPRKNSIPTLFKPLCKSTSNTHVFNQTHDDPQETFTPKFLVKSSSSSAIFNAPSASMLQKIQSSTKNSNHYTGFVQSITSPALLACQNKISKNNELLKTQNKALFHEPKKQSGDNFFVKQSLPQFGKATANYHLATSKSNAQLPIYGNLPSKLSSGAHKATNKNSSR